MRAPAPVRAKEPQAAEPLVTLREGATEPCHIVGDEATVGEAISPVVVFQKEHLYSLPMSDTAPGPGFTPDPETEEAVRASLSLLGDGARRCGLYMESASASLSSPDEAPQPPLIVASFAVGDIAFTDRVLNPPVEEVNKAVRTMEVDADLDRFNDARRRLAAGEGPLGDLEGEG